MADRIGQQIGNYRLVRLLGRGGFAEVYLGEHIHLGTQAAVKMFDAQLAAEDIESFRTETGIIARLIHPNIVRVLDFGIEAGTPFLVMSYAPNGILRQRHARGTIVPLPTIVSYTKQMADALQYAHGEKLIHRDVKPENMLVGRRDEILLSDFGIALVAQSSRLQQGTQDVIGTLTYMAPEQLQGRPRPASDQYSLAIMVYEWLTGAAPFQGSFTEVANQHMFTTPPSLREKVPTIPFAVEQVVMKALAKEPQQRFESVRAFATALEQANQVEWSTMSSQLGGWSLGGSAPPAANYQEPSAPNSYGPTIMPGSSYGWAHQQQSQLAPPPPFEGGQSPYQPGYIPQSPPPRSSKPGLSSLFEAAGSALSKVFSGWGKRKTEDHQLSLFAITRASLENDDRAIIGKSYTVRAGISQNRPENFAGEPFDLRVRDLAEPIQFDILLHTSENIEPVREWHKSLLYDPRNLEPQLVEFTFRLVAPGHSSLRVSFYHEQRWLKTVRLEFDAIEQSQLTPVSRGG